DHIIKSLVFMADRGRKPGYDPVLVIVTGDRQVDERKLAELLRTEDVRMADPEEVHDATGFRIGGVPPVGTGLPKIVDEAVMAKDTVYGGGGSDDRIIELDPRFIVGEDDLVRDVTV
ncbi:MAG: aminoacyl-tRNA deacylase, partial [Candidatus Nanohaloarchaea archaeon]